MVNEYSILRDDKVIAFARQKRLAFREKFTLYKDETQAEVLATSTARSIIDLGAVYDIADGKGNLLAAVKKDFAKSLLRSTWLIYDADMKNKLFTLSEKNMNLAIFRRLWEILPFVGDIPFFVKYHFVIKSGEKEVGEYRKITQFRDHYVLSLDKDHARKLDERAWMVIAVLLDAMQSR